MGKKCRGVVGETGNGSIEIDFAMSVLEKNSHKNEKFLLEKLWPGIVIVFCMLATMVEQLRKVVQKLWYLPTRKLN